MGAGSKLGLRACALAFLLSVHGGAQEADSAARSAARDLGHEGVTAFEAGDYAAASDRLERAYAILRVPSLGLWSARALEKQGKLVEASERYVETSRLPVDASGDPSVQEAAKRDALSAHEQLRARIPKVLVEVVGLDDPKQATVKVNGVPVASALFSAGRPTNPGEVEVTGSFEDRTVSETVALAEGETKTVRLDFSALQKWLPWIRPSQQKRPRRESQIAPEERVGSRSSAGRHSGSAWPAWRWAA